jgi:hypothetical protein
MDAGFGGHYGSLWNGETWASICVGIVADSLLDEQ